MRDALTSVAQCGCFPAASLYNVEEVIILHLINYLLFTSDCLIFLSANTQTEARLDNIMMIYDEATGH